MALRIGMGKAAGASTPMPQPETQLQNADPTQDPDSDQSQEPDADADDSGGDDSQKISPQNAGYQGPDQGPFICANCVYFDNNHCEVVAGPIDHLGCCNNFTSMGQQQGGGPQDQEGGNTTGDQSNALQSATDVPTQEPDESEMA